MNLFENPFYILGASTRDNRQQILDLSQEKMLLLDARIVSEAKLTLTTPSKRISAEISWLPGVSKSKCKGIMQFLENKQTDLTLIGSLPPLAALNVMTARLSYWDNSQKSSFTDFIHMIASKYEEINTDNLTITLNEERSIAKMPGIANPAAVQQAIETHTNYCIEQIQHLLDKLPISRLSTEMLLLVETCIRQKKRFSLIDTLIDKSYAIKIHPYLIQQSEKIKKSAEEIEQLLSDTPQVQAIDKKVEEFIRDLSVFDEVMQPLQLNLQQRGLEHQESKEIAYVARGLAIDLLNKAQKEELSEKLMKKVKELFTEIASVDERVSADLNDLKEIQAQRKEWEKQISCSVSQWGWGSRKLDISAKGITVCNSRHYKLEDVISIRYGITRHYTNGIHTSTDTLVYFRTKNNTSEMITWLNTKNWETVVDCLYRSVGFQILLSMIQQLALGNNLYGVIYDDKVLLAKTHFFTPTEIRFFSWNEVVIFAHDGFFVIAGQKDRSWSVSFSYQYDDNTHIIDNMIHTAFKQGTNTISQAFGMTKEKAQKGRKLHFGPERELNSYGYIFSWIFTIIGGIILLAFLALR